MIYLFGASLLIIACLFSYQKIATAIDDRRFPPPGSLIDIGGCRLHALVSGADGPTVVLDAGLSGLSLGWTLVQEEVSKFARVCSYDRAGYGWSDAASSKRTSQQLAEELHRLLHTAGIPGPYILVGHSFGGCNVLMFADMYPIETLGVILVDSVHEKMLDVLPLFPQNFFDKILGHAYVQYLSSALGYRRLKGPSSEIKRMFDPLPIAIKDQYFAQMNKTSYTQIVAKEMDTLPESLSQLEARQIHLHNKPLIVITAGRFSSDHEKELWQRLQKDLLTKSDQTTHLIAAKSDHMIPHHQPQIIIDAIREIREK